MRRLALILVLAALGASGTAAAAPLRAADELLPSQEWWLADVGADRVTPPGPGVPLTIVDSGVDPTHPELANRPNTSFLNGQTVTGPGEWHGTAVASVAAAPANGVGVVGVYPQAQLQIFDASPTSQGVSDFEAITGILAAARHCPGVINLSFGGSEGDPDLENAVLTAFHAGCLVVASAGNDGLVGNPVTFPADYPHVLTVASTGPTDQPSDFSTQSPAVDLAAPGEDLVAAVPLTHDPSGYQTVDGTSFSAPIVSAAAAWVWTMRPTLDVTQLFDLLRLTARDVAAPGFDAETGFGILDLPKALTAPAPPRDPSEPNDDVDQVKPGALFAGGEPALTTPAKPSIRVAARLDASEDPRDLYRIWVPAHRFVRVFVSSNGTAAARIWGPQTVSVGEGVAERRRDLKGPRVYGGNKGFAAYVEVLLTGRSGNASYVLRVTASKR